jgi:uncharacterized DUF497 family protein
MRTSIFFSEGQSEAVHQRPESDPPVETVVYNHRDESIQAKPILPETTVPQADGTVDFPLCALYILYSDEWDREKNRINQQKHGGIAFESAALVFDDPRVILRKDRIVTGEQRWHAIGAVEGAVLLVARISHGE